MPDRRFVLKLQRAPIGIIDRAPDGTITAVNDRTCDKLGYGESYLKGHKLGDLLHPEDERYELADFDRLVRGETVADAYAGTVRLLHADRSSIVPVMMNTYAFRDQDGAIIELTSFLTFPVNGAAYRIAEKGVHALGGRGGLFWEFYKDNKKMVAAGAGTLLTAVAGCIGGLYNLKQEVVANRDTTAQVAAEVKEAAEETQDDTQARLDAMEKRGKENAAKLDALIAWAQEQKTKADEAAVPDPVPPE